MVPWGLYLHHGAFKLQCVVLRRPCLPTTRYPARLCILARDGDLPESLIETVESSICHEMDDDQELLE